MIYVVIEKTRKSTRTPWTPMVNSYVDRRIEELIRDGKILMRNTVMSPDKLSLFSVIVWRYNEDIDEFRNDPLISAINERTTKHCQERGITSKYTRGEIGNSSNPDQHETLENPIGVDEFLLSLETKSG